MKNFGYMRGGVGWISLPFAAGALSGLGLLAVVDGDLSTGAGSAFVTRAGAGVDWIRVALCAVLIPAEVVWLVAGWYRGRHLNMNRATSLIRPEDGSRNRFRWRTAGQCFLLGMCCALLHSMMPSLDMEGWLERIAVGYGDSLKSLIRSLPWRHDGSGELLTALLTGDRTVLPREAVLAFRCSGASHILALSGLHLGIICLLISKGLSVLGNSPLARRSRAYLTIGLCWFYCLMAGAGPSLVRALLFVCVGELSSLSARRQPSGPGTLLCALMIQLAIRPESMLQAGFQLSYLATAGIVFAFPVLRDFYAGRGVVKKIWDMAALTLSCQILTAPWCRVLFGSLPRHFLLTNLIAMPMTTLAVGSGVIVLALSALGICPPFAVRLCDFLLHALFSALDIIARM